MRAISDVRRQASKNIARKKPATKKKRKTLFERYGAPEEDESLKSLKLMQRIKEQSELHNLSERVRSNKKQKKKEQGGGVDWANTKHSHIDSAQGPIAQLALRRLQHREAMKAKAAALKLAKLQGLRQAYEGASCEGVGEWIAAAALCACVGYFGEKLPFACVLQVFVCLCT